jgi:hypothetical protein
MTGTITSLSNQTSSGAIRSAEGRHFDFDLAEVLAYDVGRLAEGQTVHFELASGAAPKAINISTERPLSSGVRAERSSEVGCLRYIGFAHDGNVRTYRFEKCIQGGPPKNFAIATDLVLFQKCQVRIQDGPAVCLWFLSEEIQANGDGAQLSPLCLTEQKMISYLASRPIPGKPAPKKVRRAGPCSPQNPWT